MSGLDSIPVLAGQAEGSYRTENLRPLMLQLEQALRDLKDGGGGTVIDLGAMPFSQQDEEDLRQQLGKGEVTATLDAFGPTLIQETAVPAIWLIEHKDADGRRLTLHIEVARIPGILVTPEEDIAVGLVALKEMNTPPDDPSERAS